jgi:hypothetical protein
VRPPSIFLNHPASINPGHLTAHLAAVRTRPIQKIENNPMHSSRRERNQWVAYFPNSGLTRRAKHGQDVTIRGDRLLALA